MNTNDFKTRTEIIEEQSTCPEGYWVLGLDTGYSSVKGKSPNKRFAFPYYAKKVPEGRAFLREAVFAISFIYSSTAGAISHLAILTIVLASITIVLQ